MSQIRPEVPRSYRLKGKQCRPREIHQGSIVENMPRRAEARPVEVQ